MGSRRCDATNAAHAAEAEMSGSKNNREAQKRFRDRRKRQNEELKAKHDQLLEQMERIRREDNSALRESGDLPWRHIDYGDSKHENPCNESDLTDSGYQQAR